MILHWFLAGLKALSLVRGFAFPFEPQGLLRHLSYLWHVHLFAAQQILTRICFVSGPAFWRDERHYGWHIYRSLLSAALQSQIYKQTAITNSNLCRRTAVQSIFLSSVTGRIKRNINMHTLKHQMREELLKRLCVITSSFFTRKLST